VQRRRGSPVPPTLFTQLRDGQAAVAVTELEADSAERLREAMRFVVTRALV